MRVVTLLPSLTEIAWALGLADCIAAVTHECDYPPAAREKPRLTRSLLPSGLSHREIDDAVRERVAAGLPLYELDVDFLSSLEPDLILTQALCPVCAVSVEDVCRIARALPRAPAVVSVEPTTVREILDSIMVIGTAVGRPSTARATVAALERRLAWIAGRVSGSPTRPRVVCLEWLDPPIVAGHWVPEMVALAGGIDVLGQPGQPSFTVDWERVAEVSPDVLVLMPCGYDLEGTLQLAAGLLVHPAVFETPAFPSGRIWAVDASSYFSRPGPRIVRGVEILAAILHPECCTVDGHQLAAPVRLAHSSSTR